MHAVEMVKSLVGWKGNMQLPNSTTALTSVLCSSAS
jgi:hypothetical protein